MVTTDRLYMIVISTSLLFISEIRNESEMIFLFLKLPNHSEICNNHNNNS